MGNPRNDRVTIRENQPFTIDILQNDQLDFGEYPNIAGSLYDWMHLDDQYRIIGTTPLDSLAKDQQVGTVLYYRLTNGITDSSNLALVLITIVGVNDAPVFADPGNVIVGEHAPDGSIVTRIRASDVDTGARLTYRLTDDANGKFAIDSASGLLTVLDGDTIVRSGRVIEYVRVEVTDEFGARDRMRVAVQVVPSVMDGEDSVIRHATAAPAALYGGDGNDLLVDRFGSALMVGGGGNDVYRLTRDPLADDGFAIGEAAEGGLDSVTFSGGRFTLPDNVENLSYRPIGDRDHSVARGNALDNVIVAHGQATVEGGAGNDRIVGSIASDALRGGDGNDTLLSGGGAGRDLLDGGRGDDTIYADNARIYGGDGADRFLFRDGHSVSEIYDYALSQGDRIVLTAIDANAATETNDRFRFIGTDAFSGVAGQLRYVVDVVGEATFVQGDVDGDGSVDFLLTLPVVQVLHAGDFDL